MLFTDGAGMVLGDDMELVDAFVAEGLVTAGSNPDEGLGFAAEKALHGLWVRQRLRIIKC